MNVAVQTANLQNCMLSNKEYYKPVLEDKEMFEETKEKFDTATSSTSPQELANSSDSSEAEKEESPDSPTEPAGALPYCAHVITS